MFERKNPIIMGRIRLENIKEDEEKEKFDAVVAQMERRVRNGRRRKVCHLQWYTVICVLSIGTLSGLILTAAQIEIVLANKARDRSLGNITDRLRVNNDNNSDQVEIKQGSVGDKNVSMGNIASILINSSVISHSDREIDVGDDSKNKISDTNIYHMNGQINGDDEFVNDKGGARSKRGVVSDFIGDGSELLGSLGNVKNFMFSLARPILKSLGRNQNMRVLQGFTNRMLPQTGFQSHARGNLIKQKVENGFYQQAIDIMGKHRVKIDVDKLSELPDDGTNEGSSTTYKQCKKMLPHIDTLIAERL